MTARLRISVLYILNSILMDGTYYACFDLPIRTSERRIEAFGLEPIFG